MYPSRNVTFISALMNSFVLYVKRAIIHRRLRQYNEHVGMCQIFVLRAMAGPS